MKKPTQAAIAVALGVSPATITKHKQQGMPTTSIAAAREWRRAHLYHHRMRPEPETQVQRAERLAELAAPLCEAGALAELRAALRDVPQSHRPALRMPVNVWKALTESVSNVLEPEGADMSDDEAEAMGRFWFDVATAA